jgi:hypothetical protein
MAIVHEGRCPANAFPKRAAGSGQPAGIKVQFCWAHLIRDIRVEPTNNLAEREARHGVMDRRIIQGTRGSAGGRWCERIWTVLATCSRQKREGFALVAESLRTCYADKPQPSPLHVS